jgi:uncharacterized protein YkwD
MRNALLFCGQGLRHLTSRIATLEAAAVAVLLFASHSAHAVIGTPPTVTCDAAQCQTCIECENNNGACRCLKCGIDPQCLGSDPGLSSDFTEMLKTHNNYRAQHGTPALSWSQQLAKQSQDWANACTPEPNNPARFAHSPGAWKAGYGENLFWGAGTTGTDAVDWWYSEGKRYDFNNPYASFTAGDQDSTKEVRHFTQVVWRDSKELGCAVANCGGQSLWVCQYSPPGNFNAQNPGVLEANVPRPRTVKKIGKLRGTIVEVVADTTIYRGPNGEDTGTFLRAKTPMVNVYQRQDPWFFVQWSEGGQKREGWVYSGSGHESLRFP